MLILKILGIAGLSILGLVLLAFAIFGIIMFWQLKDGIF